MGVGCISLNSDWFLFRQLGNSQRLLGVGFMNPSNGKGSGKRKENTKRVQGNLDQVKWGVRDKSKDDFKVNIKGAKMKLPTFGG